MRPIGEADCEWVAALVRQAFAGLAVDPPPSALRVSGADVRAHLASGGGGLAQAGQGCVLWRACDGALHVSRLAVDPAHRRQGIARALLDAAEAEARRRGLTRCTLAARLMLPGNLRLFTGHGYREVSRHAHDGFAEPTWAEFEKRLEPAAPPGV